ncbi:uracil-DNA glycosylase [bacterium]|nr:MAG: uracil-DNA glycosylase [bacterium]
MHAELAALAAELRARAELLDDRDWSALTLPSPASGRGDEPSSSPPLPPAGEGGVRVPEELARLAAEVEACRKCPLGATRLKPAFGVGSPTAQVMFVGEGPGYEEDRQGEPFVGKAGQLLDKILASVGLSRQAVYIANVVKCHPMVDASQPDKRGNDRPPTPDEMAACRGYLEAQIRLIRPKVLVALGSTAAKCLLATEDGVGRLRGRWHDFAGTPLLVTYHPAALLRDETYKRPVWEDMKTLMRTLEAG